MSKVTNEFYLTGQLKKTTGVRTHPVEYTYDYAGRMATMKTWTNYPSGAAAITTWAYDVKGSRVFTPLFRTAV